MLARNHIIAPITRIPFAALRRLQSSYFDKWSIFQYDKPFKQKCRTF